MTKKIIIAILLIIGSIILVFLAGRFWLNAGITGNRLAQSQGGDFGLINKTVTADLGKYYIINFRPLKEEFIQIQKKYPQKTYIYLIYLNNASWVGLNEKDNFTAASTVKVPLAMALYKAIEDKKMNLADNYTLEELDLSRDFGDLYKVGTDSSFSIQELAKIMLEKSDNTAQNAIFDVLKKIGIEEPLANVYQFFGWVFDFGQIPNYGKINLKTLSDMFIALYNAKYVNIEHSQQILEYLSNSPFDDKIVAGVPKNIPVAHKIGISEGDETFSDCGIIYAPNRNYILCLGSNGGNEKIASKFMTEISAAAYKYIINN